MSYSIHKLTALPARAISSFSKASGDDIQCEGWLLKKRRRKHQGYARRYFVLRASGVLSYAFHSQLSPREQFSLNAAAISSNSTRREIHIDCDSGVYHVKATSAGDFEMWMSAFRKFIHVATEGGTIGRRFSLARTPNNTTTPRMNKVGVTLEEISISIKTLEDAVKVIKNDEQSKPAVSYVKSKKETPKDWEGLKHIFRRSTMPSPTPFGVTADPQTTPDAPRRTVIDHLLETIELLKVQFDRLCISLTPADGNTSVVSESPVESLGQICLSQVGDRRGAARRESGSTSMSGEVASANIWYDALEGPEEFVIPDDNTPSSEFSEIDLESPESIEAMLTLDATEDGYPANEESDSGHTQQLSDATEVVRRTILPAPISGNEVSLFALLRKNIGKDLSTISFPVTSNEPLGLLQRIAEDMEYADLLSQACSATDPTERMCLVAAFAVSGFACTRLRSGRKPFTPMLGETFEDSRTRFIAEKVSNHPLIVASHAEGDGWEWWATNAGKNHFWGKSLEIEQTGTTHLRIGQNHFQWSKPSCFIRNLMVGTKYLEHVGSLSIENKATGARCIIEFQEAGYWGTPNLLSGTVYSPQGNVETRLEGTWHEQLSQLLSRSHLRVLWRANALPKHAPDYYGLTFFATTLNEITKDIEGKLPPTDTRYRPDLRALEEGDAAVAEVEKVRVETAQRERRSRGAEVEPKWFKKVGPEEYVYKGEYWEQRTKGWAGLPSLW